MHIYTIAIPQFLFFCIENTFLNNGLKPEPVLPLNLQTSCSTLCCRQRPPSTSSCMKNLLTLTTVFLLCLSPLSFAGKIYKWTDSEGNTHYGERPPGNQATQVKVPKGPAHTSTPSPTNQQDATKKLLDAFEQDFAPIDDMRASADYRMRVAKNLLRRYFHESENPLSETRLVGREATI